MPGVAVHTHVDPMIGVDLHDEAAPPGVPAPCVPHLVAGLLCTPPWGLPGTGKPNPKVWATGGMVVSQGSDMGFFIPHIPVPAAPANLLTPIAALTSGSKSNFGAHKNRAHEGPLAAACLGPVGLNLNCAGSSTPPLPTGAVLALFQTVQQGFTCGDAIAGAIRGTVDCFLQYGINQLFDVGPGLRTAKWLENRLLGPIARKAVSMAVRRSPLGAGAALAIGHHLVRGAVGAGGSALDLSKAALSTLLGTPIGFSPSFSPGALAGKGEDGLQNAIASSLDRLFEDPTIEQFPNAAELGPWPGL